MRIHTLEIRRFRCIKGVTIPTSRLCTFLGRNGSGKSSILHALRVFFENAPRLSIDDFYNRDPESPIEIQVTFEAFLPQEREAFATYIHEDRLTVTRRFELNGGSLSDKAFAAKHQHPDFAAVRALQGARPQSTRYNELVASERFPGLERAASAPQALERMTLWELENPDECELIPEQHEFFGAVGVGKLDNFTQLVFVPAVRDAADEAAEGKATSLGDLLRLLVKERLSARREVQDLQSHLNSEYERIFDRSQQVELDSLETGISRILDKYHPRAKVCLDWTSTVPPTLPLPPIKAELEEDGFVGPVSRKGHGVQRALLLSLLQLRAETAARLSERARAAEDVSGESFVPMGLILAIEEPELYQHPLQSRHWHTLLRELAYSEAQSTQVLLATHSPYFVDMSTFNELRAVHKREVVEGHPQESAVFIPDLLQCARKVMSASGRNPAEATEAGFIARARPTMSLEINEGFFARGVVLVEGDTERGILSAVAQQLRLEWDARGIAIVSAGGKGKMDRPFVIFQSLNVAVYPIFDTDSDKAGNNRITAQKENLRLLNLFGGDLTEPFPRTTISAAYTAIAPNLEALLHATGDAEPFVTLKEEAALDLSYDGSAAGMKNADCASLFVEKVYARGHRLEEVEEIVETANRLWV